MPLVAYNASYDATLLRVEFNRVSVEFDDNLWDKMILLDPYVMDCVVDKYRKGGHKLGQTAKVYGYDLENAHNASADVIATLYILKKIMPKFLKYIKDKFGQEAQNYDDLMQIQSILYREKQVNTENYYKKNKDPNANFNKSWPFADPEED